MVSDELVVFDNLSGRLHLIVHADPNTENAYRQAQQRLDELTQTLRKTAMDFHQNKAHRQVNEEDFQSGFTEKGFTDAVEKAKQYINDGDIMQVVLSQRLTIPYSAPPIDLYRALRTLNPSPYMYYLNLGEFFVVGSSPEILVRMEDQEVTVRPIAGTRPRGKNEEDFQSGFTQQGFTNAVEKAKQYINDGDIMQVVLSQRLTISYSAPPIDLYRALRTLNPSPYMFYMHLDDFYVVGSSPEILVRMEDKEVTVRPIAGTRPRGKNEEEDIALEQDLLSDPKELAEHLMLIDLGRNDVGRVSKTGTVELTDKMVIERYSHVMHIVSNVTGQVLDDMSAIDALRATFPAGTVSGAPKVRAMEIIDELEPVKRGVYAGAVGYLSWSGNMDTAIAIRTAVIKNDLLHIQAGAGIVYDSVPEMEWKETMNKARAIFRAVAMAEAGLEANPHAES
jgi:anthranilate/para-aminobenzoate synthase component I